LGIWKDFEELENSISMPELVSILVAKREKDQEDRKFLAAIQGIDLDKDSTQESDSANAWEDLKARVFSGGSAVDSSDIVSLQGINAVQAGFGIGMGLDYQKVEG
jgi:translation initiation factor 1 (eIF-1/SUI1)